MSTDDSLNPPPKRLPEYYFGMRANPPIKKRPAGELPPADRIIARYMPNAIEEQKEEARESLQSLARLMIRVEERKAREWQEQERKNAGITAENP
jgi:hypothetical protein